MQLSANKALSVKLSILWADIGLLALTILQPLEKNGHG